MTHATTSTCPRRRRSDAAAAGAPDAEGLALQAPGAPARIAGACVAAALGLTVSVALVLFFVLCLLAGGTHERAN